MEPLRVGILGAARIARKNVLAMMDEHSDCTVTAVASRNPEKAQAFVDQYVRSTVQIMSYEELVESENVCDALYIPLPTSLHKEWVERALRAGKHVLLEKPVALSASDWQDMLSTAKACKRYLQDGTMFPHHKRTSLITSHSSDATRIETSFSFLGDETFFQQDIRAQIDGDPLGCIGDLGWYCVRLGLLCFDGSKPLCAHVLQHTLRNGVPVDASCVVHFEHERVLFFHCGFLTPLRQTADIVLRNETLRVDDYVLPQAGPATYESHRMSLTSLDLLSTLDKKTIVVEQQLAPQEVLMWKCFAQLARSGWDDPQASKLADTTLQNQKVLDALMESIAKVGASIQIE